MGKKGLPPTKREPAEKKALSYAKDRRNSFGESTTAARKAIPRRKAMESRADRHAANELTSRLPLMPEEQGEVAESSIRQAVARKGGWKKVPDQPLADHIERQRKWAEFRVDRKSRARKQPSP
jgi:hypothetical protein